MSDFEEHLSKVMGKFGVQHLEQPARDNSLEYFYRVRDSVNRVGKGIHTYEFKEDIHKTNGLIVVPITDLHLGHKQANVPYFREFLKFIEETPNCVTILNGDLAETATKISVGMSMFEEKEHFPEQMKILKELLSPLAKKNKILGMGPGNHEERVANMIGINPMEMLAESLGVPYFGYQGFFRIVVNGIIYKAAFNHGVGGGSTNGSKTNSAEKMNKVIPNADLYFSGHTHGLQSHSDIIYIMDDNSDTLIPHKRTYVVGGSFLEYWGGYSEMKVLPPAMTGSAYIQLRPDKKDVRVVL